jgi:dolichol-phosphate mannosyltransferase
MKLSIISPTYNEAENVGPLVEEVSRVMDGVDYEILIVDDDSPDLTWMRAEEIGKRNPRVRVLRRVRNRGLGAAVVDGFKYAQGNVVACIDADLQHDPSILPQMLQELEKGSDVVIGSRYTYGGGIGDWSRFRKFASWFATKMAQICLGIKLYDPMSGYFMLRRNDFLAVGENLNVEGFKILLEIMAKLKPKRVTEIPFTFRPRTAGSSKLSSKVAFQFIHQLWHLSRLSFVLPGRFLKFGFVGGIGVIVNLIGMTLVIHFIGWRDWRASALATSLAILNNYMLNNIWTFRDRIRTGISFLRGYVIYLAVSLAGLVVTTGVYTGLTKGLGTLLDYPNATVILPLWFLLSCQFVAISLGVYLNYILNGAITWRARPYPQRKAVLP